MTLKLFAAVTAAAGLVFAASQAQATVFTLDSIGVTAHTNDTPGLQVAIINHITSPLTFDLGAEDPQTFDLFTIYTPESDVADGEDTNPLPISVSFNFSAPTPNAVDPVTGETYGDYDPMYLWGFYIGDSEGGELVWNNGGATQMQFGNNLTGLMTITLNGGEFNEGPYGTDQGCTLFHGCKPWKKGLKVSATFDWDRDPIAVPEPGAWALIIGGFGMAGAMIRRRRAIAA